MYGSRPHPIWGPQAVQHLPTTTHVDQESTANCGNRPMDHRSSDIPCEETVSLITLYGVVVDTHSVESLTKLPGGRRILLLHRIADGG